jgi:hypothetical protein
MSEAGRAEVEPVDALPARARARSGVAIEGRTAHALASSHDAYLKVESMLARGVRPSVITETLMKEHGLGRGRANAYQAAVRIRWQRGAAMEGREQRLLRYRQMAEQAFTEAVGDGRSQAALLKVLLELEGAAMPTGNAPETQEQAQALVKAAAAKVYGVIEAEGESEPEP